MLTLKVTGPIQQDMGLLAACGTNIEGQEGLAITKTKGPVAL